MDAAQEQGEDAAQQICVEAAVAMVGELELDPAQGEGQEEGEDVSSGLAAGGSGKALVGN